MADQHTSADSADAPAAMVRVLASVPLTDRVNVEPPILNGMTATEAKAVCLAAFGFWTAVGLLLAALVGVWQVVLVFAVPGTTASVWVASKRLARIKRDRPDGYYRQAITLWLSKWGFHLPFIAHHGRWQLGRGVDAQFRAHSRTRR